MPPSPLRTRQALRAPQGRRSEASPAAVGSVHLSPQRRSGLRAPGMGRRMTPARLSPPPHRLCAQSAGSAPAAPPLRTRYAAGAAFYKAAGDDVSAAERAPDWRKVPKGFGKNRRGKGGPHPSERSRAERGRMRREPKRSGKCRVGPERAEGRGGMPERKGGLRAGGGGSLSGSSVSIKITLKKNETGQHRKLFKLPTQHGGDGGICRLFSPRWGHLLLLRRRAAAEAEDPLQISQL